jgi:hypothetical protein
MRRTFTLLSCIILTCFMIVTVANAAAFHKVSGGGTTSIDIGEQIGSFGFTAQQTDPSSCEAKGMIEYKNHMLPGFRWHAEVLYLAVDRNDAWLGGVITQSTNPRMVGMRFVWQVQDNGEGSNASEPDAFSLGLSRRRAEDACEMPPADQMLPWTNGNVQVR